MFVHHKLMIIFFKFKLGSLKFRWAIVDLFSILVKIDWHIIFQLESKCVCQNGSFYYFHLSVRRKIAHAIWTLYRCTKKCVSSIFSTCSCRARDALQFGFGSLITLALLITEKRIIVFMENVENWIIADYTLQFIYQLIKKTYFFSHLTERHRYVVYNLRIEKFESIHYFFVLENIFLSLKNAKCNNFWRNRSNIFNCYNSTNNTLILKNAGKTVQNEPETIFFSIWHS